MALRQNNALATVMIRRFKVTVGLFVELFTGCDCLLVPERCRLTRRRCARTRKEVQMENSPGNGKARLHGHSGMRLNRINSFSDAVFAVAITLLVLNIRFPVIPKAIVDEKLPKELLKLWPHYTAYVISFVVIGAFWVGHHRFFDHLARRDDWLLRLNLLFLMCIVFIPFPTNILSEYSRSRAAVILYAATLAVAGLVECLMTWYAMSGNRLLKSEHEYIHMRNAIVHNLNFSLVFLASIGVSYLNVQAAMYFWLVIIPSNFILHRFLRNR